VQQEKLELSCFHFFKNNFPEILERQGWDDEVDGELNRYTWLVRKHNVYSATGFSNNSLGEVFGRVRHIRHAAVHRPKYVPVQAIAAMLKDAIALAEGLHDEEIGAQLRPWYDHVEGLSQDAMRHVQEHNTSINTFEDQLEQLQHRISTAKGKSRPSEESAAAEYEDILREVRTTAIPFIPYSGMFLERQSRSSKNVSRLLDH
jgi:hypothetical protein